MSGFVGRGDELEQLVELLDAARQDLSGVLVLDGEAGIGKTTLLDACTAEASGFEVLRVDGVQSERALAFAALHRLLLPVLDGVEGLPAPQRQALEGAFGLTDVRPERFLVGLAALTLLADAAIDRPLLCVVDDAQWIDAESLEIISFVGRRLHADRVVLLLGMRLEPDGGTQPPEGLPRLTLGGLPTDDAHRLLAELAPDWIDRGVAERIVDETAGSPLAITEIVAALSEEQLAGGRQLPVALPLGARLEAHFGERVAALPPDTRSFLLVAAADSSGDPSVVFAAAGALGLPHDAAEPAVRAGFFEADRGMRFRHPLIRSAIYNGAGGEERRRSHRALADAIGGTDPEAHAWHRASSVTGPDDEIADELAARADRAEERGGFAAAAAFRTRSAELTVEPAARAERFLGAARAHHVAGAPQVAAALLSLAEPNLDDELLRVDARRLHGALQSYSTPSVVPAILLDAATRLVPLDGERARETFGEAIQACLVSSQFTAGTTTAEVARAALASGLLTGRDEVVGLLHRGYANRLSAGYPEAVGDLTRAVQLALRAPADVTGLERWTVLLNNLAPELWDAEESIRLLRAIEAHERERGALEPLRVTLGVLAHHAMWCGRFADSDAAHSEAAAISVALGDDAFGWDLLKVELWAWQDDDERASTMAELLTGGLAEQYGAGVIGNVGRMALTTLHLAHGRYEDAFRAAWPLFVDDVPAQGNQSLPSIVEAAVRSGEREAAEEALDRLTVRATAAGTPWALGVLARAQALVADDAEAEERYREAVDHLAASPVATELARTRLVYGEWLRRRGRRIDAREQLGPALDQFAAMGARGFEQRAQMELAATGAVARKRTPDTATALTPQELQIAHLASGGDTNREIATKLYISPSTVDYHLRKVFQKLGVSSRRQLSRALV